MALFKHLWLHLLSKAVGAALFGKAQQFRYGTSPRRRKLKVGTDNNNNKGYAGAKLARKAANNALTVRHMGSLGVIRK